MNRSLTCVCGFLLVTLANSVVGATPGDGPRSVSARRAELIQAAVAAQDAEDWAGSARLWQKVLFVSPGNKKAGKGLTAVNRSRATALVATASSKTESDRAEAVRLLREALRLDPRCRPAKKKMKALGYRKDTDLGWVLGDGESQEHQSQVDDARRIELGLGAEFVSVRRGRMRVFTNLNQKAHRRVLQQFFESCASLLREYESMFRPLELNSLDIVDAVYFASEAQFQEYRGDEGEFAGGYYSSAKGASFFHRESLGFRVVLHELTHQLNDKALPGKRPASWYEEGISIYFGAGFLTQAGRKLTLGRIDARRLNQFRTEINAKRAMSVKELTSISSRKFKFAHYPQAWATVQFLLQVHPLGRWVIYDYLSDRGKPRAERRSLVEILQAYEISVEDFDKTLKQHFTQ